MGHYDLRPSRVLHTVRTNLKHKRIQQLPPWTSAVINNAPPQILVRSQPVQHAGYAKQKAGRKPKRIFHPQQISYPEDRMRSTFFAHHPWELARPRIVQEGNRLDGTQQGESWDRVRPEGVGLAPENVIRRQLWLIESEGKDPQTAYDIARREFYRQRLREDIERKVAKEEALHVGAYFQKSTIAWGMELEDRKFYGFKEWATRRLVTIENARQAMVLGVDARNTDGVEELVQSQTAAITGEGSEDAAAAAEPIGVEATPFRIPEDKKAALRI